MTSSTQPDTWEIAATVAGGGKLQVAVLADGKSLHIDELKPALASHRKRFVKDAVAVVPALDRVSLEKELLRLAAEQAPPPGHDTGGDQGKDAAPSPELVAEVEALLLDPELIHRILDDVAALGVAGEKELVATIYLTGTSRLLEKPLALIVQGPSSSGKSYTVEKVAQLFPQEAVIFASQMTPQALFHMPQGSLAHRFVVCGERSRVEDDDRAEASRALREMLSAGRLTKLIPMKQGHEIVTAQIDQPGPIAYVESTTLSKIMNEDENRCLVIQTDERPDQTKRIIRSLALDYSGQGAAPARRQHILQRHHCLQRMLEPVPVVIPFADRVGELFPPQNVEARRAFPQLMSMVQAVCLLHQRQRSRDGDGCLMATADDYQIARRLVLKPLGRHQGRLSDPAWRFFDLLKKHTAHLIEKRFTSAEAKKWEQSAKSSVYGWLSELSETGLVEQLEPHRGSSPAVWLLTDLDPDAASCGQTTLPTVEKVFPGIPAGHADTIPK